MIPFLRCGLLKEGVCKGIRVQGRAGAKGTKGVKGTKGAKGTRGTKGARGS